MLARAGCDLSTQPAWEDVEVTVELGSGMNWKEGREVLALGK